MVRELACMAAIVNLGGESLPLTKKHGAKSSARQGTKLNSWTSRREKTKIEKRKKKDVSKIQWEEDENK